MDAVVTYVRQGGFFMYPIIGCSLWACIILIERLIFFLQAGSNLNRLIKTVFNDLHNGKMDEALMHIKKRSSVLNNVLIVALEHRNLPVSRIEEKMETVLVSQLPLYTRFLNLLSVIAGLLPILGLLGTVTGMIATFNVISLHGTGDAQAMAAGIAEALITTQAGLVAAAPVILGHVLLTERVKKISNKTREASMKILDFLKDNNA